MNKFLKFISIFVCFCFCNNLYCDRGGYYIPPPNTTKNGSTFHPVYTLNRITRYKMFVFNNERDTLREINKWYFYKDHIVGSINEINNQIEYINYFIIDEKLGLLKKFPTYKDWTNYRIEKLLIPKLWTRWFNYNWQFDLDEYGILIFMLCPFVAFFLFFYFVYLLVEKKFGTITIKSKIIVIPMLILVAIGIKYMMGIFPTSI